MATQASSGLEQQLYDLMDRHELNYVSVSVYTLSDGTRFLGASAHGGEKCGGDTLSMPGNFSDALASAIADLNSKRNVAVNVPQLEAA